MFRDAGILFLYTETPLHAGSGASVTSIDLPIQRERHTHYPMIQSSGVKGAMRDLAESMKKITLDDVKKLNDLRKAAFSSLTEEDKKKKEQLEETVVPIEITFGPETGQANEHGGALSFTDARILLFPVRSLTGVFAWITCPLVIERFKRDLKKTKIPQELENLSFSFNGLNDKENSSKAFISDNCQVKTKDSLVILEDFAFQADDSKKADVWLLGDWLAKNALPQIGCYTFWQNKLRSSLVVVPDDVFRDFVQFSMEVVSRIKIGENGTAEAGALFNEELIPPDTLFYVLTLSTNPKKRNKYIADSQKVLEFLENQINNAPVVHLGGDETVGRGIVQAKLLLLKDENNREKTHASTNTPDA